MTSESVKDVNSFNAIVSADAEPVLENERNHAIDMLRGVAVLGILVMNIYAFAMPFVAYMNPLAYGGTEPWNIGTWFVTHVFFELKFMTIFAMLFGAGLIMMMNRAEARRSHYSGIWYRRNFWLLIIGIAHGYLLWVGDILFSYALTGMLVFLFRNLSPTILVRVAIALLCVAPLLSFTGGIYMGKLQAEAVEIEALQAAGESISEAQAGKLEEWAGMGDMLGDPAEQVAKDLAGYSQRYPAVVRHRQPTVATMQTDAAFFYMIWRVGGVMLLGMALMKQGILSGQRSRLFYKRMLLVGYGIGLPIVLFGAWGIWQHQWESMWLFQVGNLPNYVGSIFVALGHIALVMTVIKAGALSGLMDRFAAVGRMAFTNYLMHSIVLTTIFYGYGLGLYGQVPRLWQMAFVLVMVSLQLWISPIWLRHFRFGPAEWLWRSLTYWRLQPMRRVTSL